jgi:hypothetical protein
MTHQKKLATRKCVTMVENHCAVVQTVQSYANKAKITSLNLEVTNTVQQMVRIQSVDLRTIKLKTTVMKDKE